MMQQRQMMDDQTKARMEEQMRMQQEENPEQVMNLQQQGTLSQIFPYESQIKALRNQKLDEKCRTLKV